MSKTSILMHSNATKTNQDNIASKNAWGTKKRETLFVNSVVGDGGSSGGGVSYVTSNTRSSNNVQGTIVSTGINSDLAMQGQGMFVVSDSITGTKVFTRRGDFRQDELGYWKNGADQLLFANKLDQNEKPIKDLALVEGLSAVNFADVKGSPKATSIVSIAMNLNSKQVALRGPGVTAQVNQTGINSVANFSSTGILFSEKLAVGGGLSIGDQFIFDATPPAPSKTLEYGGLTAGRSPTSTNPIFGAQRISDKFTLWSATNTGGIADGSSLTITLSNQTSYTFTVSLGNANPANKTFNSIQTLAQAINNTGGLNAQIDQKNGNIYIASADPNLGMTFTDIGTVPGLAGALGLTTVGQAAGGVARFNSLYSLNKAVNDQSDTYKLLATIEGGALKITSLLSQDTFSIDGTSLGQIPFSSAIQGDRTEKGRATITITSPLHGLQTGDLVNIAGLAGGQATNGIYAVGATTQDTFNIYLLSDDPGNPPAGGTIADGLPLAAAGVNVVANAANGGTWQKIAGQKFAPVAAPITAAANGGANALLTITPPAGLAGIAVGDVLYISGGGTFNVLGNRNVTIADGYYVVQALGVATFDIKSVSSVAGAPTAIFPVLAGNSLTYQKVGATEAAGNLYNAANGITTFNTSGLFTTAGLNAAAGDSRVNLYMANHNYNVGDTIRFTGLAAPIVIDGITIRNNVNYKISAVTPLNAPAGGLPLGSITLEIPPADGAVIAANVTGTYSSNGLPATNTGPAFRIDGASRLFKYFGINDVLPGTTGAKALPSTYDAGSTDKSLFGNKNLTSDNYFTYPLSLFDSLGETYNLNLRWAKLDKNRWAVEIAAVADPVTGLYDIIGVRADGQLASGEITFDQNGNFLTAGGLDAPIPSFSRKNGSAAVQLQIDWKNALSEVKGLMVTQQGIANNVELVQANGQAAGNLVNLEVSQDGFIIGTFDSGETLKLYQIPVALFANVNGLRASIGGTFEITRDSGELLLKGAMVGGAGKVLGGVLEESNVDTTEELLEIQDLSNDIRANARAANVTNKNIQTILSEIQ